MTDDRCWSQLIVKSSILGFSRQFLKTFATVYPDPTDRAPGSPRMGYRRKKFARTLIQLPTLKKLTQLQRSKPRNQLMTPDNLTLKIVSQMCSKHSIKSGSFDIFLFLVDWYCIGVKACASSSIMFFMTFLGFWCFFWSLLYHWKKILQYYCNIYILLVSWIAHEVTASLQLQIRAKMFLPAGDRLY